MLFWKIALPLVVVASAAVQPASASGGFLQKLPEDGSWVSYFMEGKAEEGPMQQLSGTMKLKSVGTETVNGEAYRWLELDFEGSSNEMKTRTLMKVLVREKDFKDKAARGMTIERGWQLNAFGDKKPMVKELSDSEKSPDGPMSFLFRCSMKKPIAIKKAKTIDYQKGRLKLETATSGELDVNFQQNQPKDYSSTFRQTIWKHKSVPTGTAALELQMEVRQKDKVVVKMTMLFTVQDYGKGAKSALPDKK